MPGAVVAGCCVAAGCINDCAGFAAGCCAGCCIGAAVLEGCEFKGAPTGISQRWPGCPCGGFKAGVAAVVVPAAGTGLTAGAAFTLPTASVLVFSIAGVSVTGVSVSFCVSLQEIKNRLSTSKPYILF